MYAVIETGGKQYKVAVGDRLKVEKLNADQGASVDFGRVLMVADGDDVSVGSPVVETAVSATVVSHGRGDKIRVFKMKRRKNYRRTQGHRQAFTEIEITAIGSNTEANKKSASKPAAKPAAEVEQAPAAEKVAQAAPAVAKDTGADGVGDDLTRINGIGPVIEKKLTAMGVTTFAQIAELDQARIDEINDQLSFKGRIEREEWVSQAAELVKEAS